MRNLEPIKISQFIYPPPTSPNNDKKSSFAKQRLNKQSYKKILALKHQTVTQEAQIFNKFSYENHKKYSRLNPFEPRRSNTVLTGQKVQRSPFNYQRNIEMIYCKNKIEAFQDLINVRMETVNITKLDEKKSSSMKRLSVPVSSKRINNEQGTKIPFRSSRGRSTLLNIMREYTELHKIDGLINPQQNIKTHNVSIQSLQRRYPFLKQLDNLVFKRVLSALQISSNGSKIQVPLKEFISLSSVLVLRDACPLQLASFTEKLFFDDEPKQMSRVEEVLDRLHGPVRKHNKIRQCMSEFFENSSLNFKKWCERHIHVCQLLIDLIVSHEC